MENVRPKAASTPVTREILALAWATTCICLHICAQTKMAHWAPPLADSKGIYHYKIGLLSSVRPINSGLSGHDNYQSQRSDSKRSHAFGKLRKQSSENPPFLRLRKGCPFSFKRGQGESSGKWLPHLQNVVLNHAHFTLATPRKKHMEDYPLRSGHQIPTVRASHENLKLCKCSHSLDEITTSISSQCAWVGFIFVFEVQFSKNLGILQVQNYTLTIMQ